MADIKQEIQRRRTFAIISHPDAGKTTLTEKFLLYGGAIQSAGAVKGKSSDRHATSDWMEIEKKEVSRSLPPYCSLSTADTASTFWTRPDTRTFPRTPTGR